MKIALLRPEPDIAKIVTWSIRLIIARIVIMESFLKVVNHRWIARIFMIANIAMSVSVYIRATTVFVCYTVVIVRIAGFRKILSGAGTVFCARICRIRNTIL
jgi:hypothetical protein